MRFLRFLALLAFVAGASRLAQAQREKLPLADLEYVEKTWPDAKKTSTGIRYIIEKEGTGFPANEGDKVAVYYIGKFINGKIFDQNVDQKKPFVFRVGRGLVISGWDQILQMMKKGETRLIIIPPELAYGTAGNPPRIPGSSTLVFEIKMVGIEREE